MDHSAPSTEPWSVTLIPLGEPVTETAQVKFLATPPSGSTQLAKVAPAPVAVAASSKVVGLYGSIAVVLILFSLHSNPAALLNDALHGLLIGMQEPLRAFEQQFHQRLARFRAEYQDIQLAFFHRRE